MAELFKGQVGSPITNLISSMTASQTTATVADANALPDAPNICTIGFGDNLETIRYGTKSGGSLGEITRGIEGAPRAWQVGTEVARFFTAYDHQAIVETVDGKTIVESGENSNGRYVKFGDGTMMCMRPNLTLNEPGWLVRENDSLTSEWVFPSPFINGSIAVSGAIYNTNVGFGWFSPVVSIPDGPDKVKVFCGSLANSFGVGQIIIVSLIAIGRWK